MRQYFKDNFELNVEKAVPFVKYKKDFDVDLYVTAIGLALRGISKDPISADINLLPAVQKRMLIEQQARSAIIYSSLVVLFVSSLLLASFNIVLSNLYFDLEGLEKANQSFQKIVEGTRYQEIQDHIQNINDSIQLAKQAEEQTYSLKEIYDYFCASLPKAIVINQFSYKNEENKHKININGFSLTRDKVIILQEQLKSTSFYENLITPLSNVLNQKNIYFSFSFDLNLKKFQEYLLEQIELKEKIAKETQLQEGIMQIPEWQTGQYNNTQNNNNSIGAFTTWSETVIAAPQDAYKTSDWTVIAKPIIPLDQNVINEESLADLQWEYAQISTSLEENENIEDQQIEEVLHGSGEEYPFKEKIHEKVGDIFVIEQKFYPWDAEEEWNTNN